VRSALKDLQAHGSAAAVRLPSRREVIERAMLLEKNLLEDHLWPPGAPAIVRGRQVLCRPQPDGFYLAGGRFLPLAVSSIRLDAPGRPKARCLCKTARYRAMDRGQPLPSLASTAILWPQKWLQRRLVHWTRNERGRL
jgi:hypothetical protein